ncbi:MAG: hypothetical protein IPJ25_00250 [Rhodocyclaceae bacterium]|nr:hypothetical protein [Rhodocyclaceae bacterium]
MKIRKLSAQRQTNVNALVFMIPAGSINAVNSAPSIQITILETWSDQVDAKRAGSMTACHQHQLTKSRRAIHR